MATRSRQGRNGSTRSDRVTPRRRLAAVALGVASLASLATATPGEARPSPDPGSAVRAAGRDASTVSDGARSATVTPGVLLTNEVVTVSWSGFPPTLRDGTNGVIVMQCSAAPTSLADCYTAEAFPSVLNGTRADGVTGADGTGSTQVEVRPAANLPELACSTTTPCSLLVYVNDGQAFPDDGLPAVHLAVPLTFAPSQADCPPVTDFDVRIDGSATSAALFYSWAGELCLGDSPLVLDYTEGSSTSGRENFLSGLTDMSITALPVSDEELESHPDHREFSYAPVAASAMVVAYNLRDPFTGNRLDDIVVSPRLVARLITNSSPETFFRDKELAVLNPGVRFPSGSATRPLIRAERTAGTTLVTSWLAADPDVESFMRDEDRYRARLNPTYLGYTYPRDIFENVSGDSAYLPRQGQQAVALRLFYGVSPTGTVRENTAFNGVIGIVDLPTARRFGLQVARLARDDGGSVAPSTESIEAGLAAMTPNDDGTLVTDVRPEDADAYPLVRVDYALVPDTAEDESHRSDLRRVLRYAVGPGQADLPNGYVPLPAELRDRTLAVARGIAVPRTPTTTSSTSTTTPSTTSPTTTVFTPTPTYTAPYDPGAASVFPTTETTAAATATTPDTSTPPSSTKPTKQKSPVPSTTVPAAITVPPEQLVLPAEPALRPMRLLGGLTGLSIAGLLGTIPPSRLRLRRPGARS